MSIPTLMILALFAVTPWYTRDAFRNAYEWQRSQISVDNAAIIVGRRDRETLNFLQSSNRILRQMEVLHHVLHVCARTPHGAAACTDKDLLMEAEIRLFHRNVFGMASAMWQSARVEAAASAEGAGTRVTIERSTRLPIRPVTCGICGLAYQWEVDGGAAQLSTKIRDTSRGDIGTRAELTGTSLTGGEAWNYFLSEGT